jgi:hypothetical protein
LFGLVIPGLDPATGSLTLPVWAAGAVAVLLILVCLVALFRSSAGVFVGLLALVIIGAGTGLFLSRLAAHDRAVERNALETRALQLAGLATAPGSPLACLDGAIGDVLEAACEKAVFATPESVAAAMSYTTARLALLADSIDFAQHSDATYEDSLVPLRRTLEGDRFGLVAQVLAQRDNCASGQCDSLALLHDANRVRANLRDRPFDGYVTRYSSTWPAHPGRTDAAQAAPFPGGTAAPVGAKYSFPSAASIPPVSIMTAEPPGAPAAAPPPPPQAASVQGAATAAPAPARRPPAAKPVPRAQAAQRNAPLPLQVAHPPDNQPPAAQ